MSRPASEGPVAATAADLAEQATLSARVYGTEADVASAEHLGWKYLDAVDGPAELLVWRVEGTAVARVVVLPQTFLFNGQRRRGGFVVDFLVDPAHRSMMLAADISRSLKRFTGFDFLYMTPNKTGIAFWQGLGKLKPVASARVAAVPLRPGTVLAGKFPGAGLAGGVANAGWGALSGLAMGIARLGSRLTAENVAATDPRLAPLLATPTEGLYRERSAAFACWRFGTDPARQSAITLLSHGGTAVAAIAWRDVAFGSLAARVILDVMTNRPLTLIERVAAAGAVATQPGLQRPDLLLSIDNDAAGKRTLGRGLPFIEIPEKMLPQPVPLFVIGGEGLPAPSFTLADCDMF